MPAVSPCPFVAFESAVRDAWRHGAQTFRCWTHFFSSSYGYLALRETANFSLEYSIQGLFKHGISLGFLGGNVLFNITFYSSDLILFMNNIVSIVNNNQNSFSSVVITLVHPPHPHCPNSRFLILLWNSLTLCLPLPSPCPSAQHTLTLLSTQAVRGKMCRGFLLPPQ